jgi:hypothetical protein
LDLGEVMVLTHEVDRVELGGLQFGWSVEKLGFSLCGETWVFYFGKIWDF